MEDSMEDFISSASSSCVMFMWMAFWKALASIFRAFSIWLPSWAMFFWMALSICWLIRVPICCMAVFMAVLSWLCRAWLIWAE